MLPRCLECNYKISLSWFNISFHWTKYRCVKCGALHEWTPRRRNIGGIAGASAAPLVFLLNTVISSYWLSGFLVIFGTFLVLPLLPGQHQLGFNKDEHNQTSKKDANNSAF